MPSADEGTKKRRTGVGGRSLSDRREEGRLANALGEIMGRPRNSFALFPPIDINVDINYYRILTDGWLD